MAGRGRGAARPCAARASVCGFAVLAALPGAAGAAVGRAEAAPQTPPAGRAPGPSGDGPAELSAGTFEAFVQTGCLGPTAVLFSRAPAPGALAAPAPGAGARAGAAPEAEASDAERQALAELRLASREVDIMVCFGVLNCRTWPDLCEGQNLRRTPSVVIYPRVGGTAHLFRGRIEKGPLLAAVTEIIALSDRTSTLSTKNIEGFLRAPLQPLKVMLFSSRKTTPVVLQALSSDRDLWMHMQFGIARHSEQELTSRFNITEVPYMFLQRGPDPSTYEPFPGDTMTFRALRAWLVAAVRRHGLEGPETEPEEAAFPEAAQGIRRGTWLRATQPLSLFSAAGAWDVVRSLAVGESLRAGGPAELVHGYAIVPVQPAGAVELAAVEVRPDGPSFQMLPYGAKACPEGLAITTLEECEQAVRALGLEPRPAWVSNYPGLPSACSVREQTGGDGQRMHFNSSPSGEARADLAPVCHHLAEPPAGPAGPAGPSPGASDQRRRKTQQGAPAKSAVPKAKAASPSKRTKRKAKSPVERPKKEKLTGPTQRSEQAKSREATLPVKHQKLAQGEVGCPAGLHVTSVKECTQALESLGLASQPGWISSFPGVPGFCSVRESPNATSPERMHFNSHAAGTGRSDLAPVCRLPTPPPSEAPADENQKDRGSVTVELFISSSELSAATSPELLDGASTCLIYLREGPLTMAEALMLLDVASTFKAALLDVPGSTAKLKLMWLDLRIERKMRSVFDPVVLPSAAVLTWAGEGPQRQARLASVRHREEDGDPVAAEAMDIETLLKTVLGGDARFSPIPAKKLTLWAKRTSSSK